MSNPTTTFQKAIANVVPGQTYILRVRSLNEFGQASAWSESVIYTVPFQTSEPAGIDGLQVLAQGEAFIVEWSANIEPDLDHYELYSSHTADFTPDTTGLSNLVYDGPASIFVYPALTGNQYYFALRAVNSSGVASAFSQVVGPYEVTGASSIAVGTVIGGTTIAANSLIGGEIDGAIIKITNSDQSGIYFEGSGNITWQPGALGGIIFPEGTGYIRSLDFNAATPSTGWNLDALTGFSFDAYPYAFSINPNNSKILDFYDTTTGGDVFYIDNTGQAYFAQGILGSTSGGGSGNFLANSSFEAWSGRGYFFQGGGTAAGSVADHWGPAISMGRFSGEIGTYSQSTAGVVAGSYSQSIVLYNPFRTFVAIYTQPKLPLGTGIWSPGTTWTFSWWATETGTNGQSGFVLYNDDPSDIQDVWIHKPAPSPTIPQRYVVRRTISPTAKYNRLSADDSVFPQGLGTWINLSNTTITLTSVVAWGHGFDSMAMTATAAGTSAAQTAGYVIDVNSNYIAMAAFAAATTSRSCTLSIEWYNSAATPALVGTSTSAVVIDASDRWTVAILSATPPAGAATARIQVSREGNGAGEVGYVNGVGLFTGTTEGYLLQVLSDAPCTYFPLSDRPGGGFVDDGYTISVFTENIVGLQGGQLWDAVMDRNGSVIQGVQPGPIVNQTAHYFNNTGYLSFTPSPSTLAAFQAHAFTVETWIYWDGGGGGSFNDSGIMGAGDGTTNDSQFYFTIRNGVVCIGFHGDDWITGYTPPKNAWTHLALTFSAAANLRSLYVDGVLYQSNTSAATLNVNANAWTIGSVLGDSRTAFYGSLSHFALYNYVVSAARITAHYNSAYNTSSKVIQRWNEGGLTGATSALYIGSITAADTITVDAVQLEQGTVASPWAPKPNEFLDISIGSGSAASFNVDTFGNIWIGSASTTFTTSAPFAVTNGGLIYANLPSGVGTNYVLIDTTSHELGYGATVSSLRYKSDVREITNGGLDNPLFKVSAKSFKYDPEQTWIIRTKLERETGLIAEELAVVAPDTVYTDRDHLPTSLNEYALLGYLVDAVNYLRREIDDLRDML